MRRIAPLLFALLIFPPSAATQEPLQVERATKEVILSGYTRAQSTVAVSSEVSGKILRVNYEVGQVVGSSPFAEIDPTFIDFQLESTRQSLRSLQVDLQKAVSRIGYLEKEFTRIDRLFREQSTAETQRDKAAEDLAQAKLESESIRVHIAEVKTALAELSERKRRHRVSAPEGWIVTDRFVESGEIVATGTAMGRVADYRELIVPLSVSARELAAIRRLASPFTTYLEDAPVETAVNWINPEFDEKTRKLNIEMILRDYGGEKRGGLLFKLPLQIETDGLRVPKAAVITRYENPRVRIQSTDEEVPVIILGESNDHFIIAENQRLSPGVELVGNN
jgi:multidrug efflux pump subunit AcrA (membrane-fusion protein)